MWPAAEAALPPPLLVALAVAVVLLPTIAIIADAATDPTAVDADTVTAAATAASEGDDGVGVSGSAPFLSQAGHAYAPAPTSAPPAPPAAGGSR